MKILFFTDHFRPEPSAPAAHVYERSLFWVKEGHNVTIITAAPNFPDGIVYPGYKNYWRHIEFMEGIRVVRVKTFISPNKGYVRRALDYISYMLSAFFFAFFEDKPDVVISTSPHIFVPISGVAYCLIRRVPHVFEIRDLWPESIVSLTSLTNRNLYKLMEFVELSLYKLSKMIMPLTNSFAENLVSRGVSKAKIEVVINGANLDLFKPAAKDKSIVKTYELEGKFVIGYMGTLGLAHDLENVIRAAMYFEENIVVFFVGSGAAHDSLKILTKKLCLNNILFSPRQLKEDMPSFLSVVDIALIHLKNVDVFRTVIPSKIFESMAMGLPIVYVGPAGEGSDIVLKHNAGVYVEPDNPKRFAQVVNELSKNKKILADYATASRNSAHLYSRKKQAENTLHVLEKAIKK